MQPGSLLHVLCTHPHTDVHITNKAGQEETVSLQVMKSTTNAICNRLVDLLSSSHQHHCHAGRVRQQAVVSAGQVPGAAAAGWQDHR